MLLPTGTLLFRFVGLVALTAMLVDLGSPPAMAQQTAGHVVANETNESSRLVQLIQSRPEIAELLKTYLFEQMQAAGSSVSREQITTSMLVGRIQGDAKFANSAARWLLGLTSQVSQTLGDVPPQPEPAEGTLAAVQPNPAPAQAHAAKSAESSAPSMQASADPLPDHPQAAQHPAAAFTASGPTAAFAPPPATIPAALPATPSPEESPLQVKSLPKYLLEDQQAFWTQPFHLKASDLSFIVPATFGTAILIGSDTSIEKHLPNSPSTINRAAKASTAGMASLLGVGGGLYLWGKSVSNERARETGFLMGEAAISAYAASTILQYTTQRERPFTGNGKGSFFYGGNSFPSNTAAVSWAAASVLTREYPGFLTKLFAYGVASGVSMGRVVGQKHWTSDVVVGSALGWYMGRQIYRARSSEHEINASTWGTFIKTPEEQERDPAYMGTTYVPLDSWVYQAMDRLAAMGYVPTMIQAIKPWARMYCARMTLEAQEMVANVGEKNPAVAQTIQNLRSEFAVELANLEGAPNVGVELESLYARVNQISGRPVYDSWHFAQTLYNDFGRPYGEGFNFVSGVSGRAEAGPLAFYVRGEYQHSASMPNYSNELATLIASYDGLPANSVPTFNSINRLRLLDSYVALNAGNWQVSAGLQSLSWGPDYGGSLIYSNNAAPMPMVRMTRLVPYQLPWLFSLLGKIQNTVFFGSLKDVTYLRGAYPDFALRGNGYTPLNPQPYTWGDKLAIKMSPNLEIGVSLSVIWAGSGRPATLKTWLHTFNTNGNNQRQDPGKRYTGFNFSYRVPGLRNWVVLYADGMANDEPNPVAYSEKSAWNPGLYFPRIPFLPRLDLRVEGLYTNVPNYPGLGPYYFNAHYAQGYRLYNQIIGSWVGRQGSAVQAWSTYWFSPQKKVQVGYRRQWNDPVFEGGGGLTDFSVNVDWLYHNTIQLSALGQYERWNFPELTPWAGPMPQSNFTLGLQMTFWPMHSSTKPQATWTGTR